MVVTPCVRFLRPHLAVRLQLLSLARNKFELKGEIQAKDIFHVKTVG